MTTDKSLQAIDSFWAEYFGCSIDTIRQPGLHVVRHGRLKDNRGVLVLVNAQAYTVSAPPEIFETVIQGTSAPGIAPAMMLDIPFWEGVLGNKFDQAIGPTWLAYADNSDFYATDTSSVVQLKASDSKSLEALRNACVKAEWANGNISLATQPTFGYFLGDSLVAVAGYGVWAGKIGHIGVVTHPQLRGKGLGKTTVSAAAEHGLKAGLVMQYETLASNQPSKGIGKSLGFRRYGRTLSVRIKGR